jgi:hypothetical protein
MVRVRVRFKVMFRVWIKDMVNHEGIDSVCCASSIWLSVCII